MKAQYQRTIGIDSAARYLDPELRTPTIVADLSLFRAHQLMRRELALADKFLAARLRQIRKAQRKQKLKILWLKIKKSL